MQTVRSAYDPQVRVLFYQLAAASFAVSDALQTIDQRSEHVEEALEALEAFELLERGPSSFSVPRDVRAKVRASLEALREGHLELAHASLTRAGGAFEKHVTTADRPRRWTH